MALTKNAVVEEIRKELGFPRNECLEVAETLIEIIKSSLESGEDVLVSGFGKFCVQEKKARKGRNPATGTDLMLKSRRRVAFKCSGLLREKINGK